MPAPNFLDDSNLKLFFFGGKGGVGKTVCALAAALLRAKRFPKQRVILVSTDPAHSVVDAIAGTSLPGNLQVCELDSRDCLERFKAKHLAELREIAARGTFLDQDDINQFLDLSMPGMDELMAFLEITEWVKSGAFGAVIVDTAPTGHTLRLLEMPAVLGQWLGALDAFLAKHRYLREKFGGESQPDHLDRFLKEMTDSVEQMETLMRNPALCRFVPVMLAEPLSVEETIQLLGELRQFRMPVADILVNRFCVTEDCPACKEESGRQWKSLAEARASFADYTLWGIPLYAKEVRGWVPLQALWSDACLLKPFGGHPAESSAAPFPVSEREVELPASLPGPEMKLLIFAGKGGTGKTTLACATAFHLARLRESDVLLFSTDPAHSLSACLQFLIGPKFKRIAPFLSAVEMKPQAEFERLKQLYRRELEHFLDSVLQNADLAFDRPAMERLIDLSPTGLDELIAVLQIIELFQQEKFSAIVLDTAPTGHLLRLLEMPELIDQWLKAFFALFLKYKRVFRLPMLTERLIEISKGIKTLRSLLANPERCVLYPVCIPTDMGFEETKDLVAACRRMRLSIPALFLNQVTPPRQCPLCATRHREELRVREKYRRMFPELAQTIVYRQGDLRGESRLARLGRTLYQSASVGGGPPNHPPSEETRPSLVLAGT